MTNINYYFTHFFIYLCIASVTAVNLSVSSRSEFCKDGLEKCISRNCYGSRKCKSVINSFYPNCTRCVDDILDQNNYEIVNGNYHLACDPNDDLQISACYFYCRVYYYPVGQCVTHCSRCSDEETNINTTLTTTTTTATTTKTKKGNLLHVFSNPTIQSTITQFNGNSFGCVVGFGMYSSSNTQYYYVIDYLDYDSNSGRVYILNDNWVFLSYKAFTYPAYMITIGTSLYMTGEVNVWKLDENLNVLIEYNPNGPSPWFRGISYTPSNGLLYVVAYNLNFIHVLDLNLTFKRNISTEPYKPWSITEYSNQLYVGSILFDVGIILVIQNDIIVNQFKSCGGNSNWLLSILFDQFGYMATSCYDPTNKLYLYSPNGTSTGKSITTPEYPYYIGFDSKSQFIQISANRITIYK